jgi:Na+/proline symporter
MLFVVLLVIYIAFMIVLGFIASKRANDIQGYATSHGDVGPFQTALTFAACFASAGTFLGLAGQGYAYGITNVWFWASQWTTCGIILAIVVKRYRKTTKNLKCVSIADWIGDRYKSQGLRAWLAVISVFQILYISSQLGCGHYSQPDDSRHFL